MKSRAIPVVLALALAASVPLVAVPPVAYAQEDAAEVRAIDADLDRLRNNPFLAGDPERVRKLVLSLLERRQGRADTALREMLLDPRTHANVVEQIASLTLVAQPHRLLDDVVERIRTDSGSALEARLAAGLLHADMHVVRRLTELATDTGRTVGYRRTAIRMLGRTGDAAGLAVLADLWGGPEKDLRAEAQAAFEIVAPSMATTPDEAREFVERLRREDLSLTEALRRRLREVGRPELPPPAPQTGSDDYRTLALELLPRANLDQVLRLYVLGSPSPEVRAAAVRRLASYPYDDTAEPEGRARAARTLFVALRREDSSTVELAILTTLPSLAASVRGNVATDDMEALLARVRPPGATRETRLAAVRVLRELRDVRCVAAAEAAYVALGDTEAETRLALLDALQEVPVDRTAWIAERLGTERKPEIQKKLVLILGRSREPAAAAAFAALISDHDRVGDEVRRDAASALATQWAAAQSLPARDALLGPALADSDPGVRAIAAGALGIAGPGSEATVEKLLAIVRQDRSADVRRAAAGSVVLLDEAHATEKLMGRFAEDPVVFEVVRGHLLDGLRSDQSPDQLLAAADTLVAGNLRPFAVEMLDQACRGVLTEPKGRARVRASLARLLLDEGRPADALASGRALAAEAKDDAARDTAELIVCRALTAAGEANGLAEAERRLVALRSTRRLDAANDVDAAATLADCLLRRGNALAAAEVLDVDAESAPASTRLRVESLRGDARAALARDRAEVVRLVEALSGPDAAAAEEARTRLWQMSGRAAYHLARELEGTPEPVALRGLLAAAAAVMGTEPAALPAEATAEKVAAVVESTRKALLAAARSASPPLR